MELRTLPVEILDLIISNITDSPDSVALPVSHPVAKTIWSCLFVSKATYPTALEQLYQRCLYVDSAWRLRALLRAYGSRCSIPGRSADPLQFKCAASTGLYLSPFTKDTIDERPVINDIQKLFKLLDRHLKRLVIDMPLRSYYPDEPGSANLRLILRNSFLQLQNVQEFISVRDELYLSTRIPGNSNIEPPVWSQWTHLRRLALYNLCIDQDLKNALDQMHNLMHLVLTRPDTEDVVEEESYHWHPRLMVTVVNSYRDFCLRNRLLLDTMPSNNLSAGATITIVQTKRELREDGGGYDQSILNIICIDGQNPLKERRSQLPQPRNRFNGNNWAAYDLRDTYNDIRESQQWIKRSALDGSLWLDRQILLSQSILEEQTDSEGDFEPYS